MKKPLFNEKEKKHIETYFGNGRMYMYSLDNKERIDCSFVGCDECVFNNRCIIGGSDQNEILEEVQKIVPEHFI